MKIFREVEGLPETEDRQDGEEPKEARISMKPVEGNTEETATDESETENNSTV